MKVGAHPVLVHLDGDDVDDRPWRSSRRARRQGRAAILHPVGKQPPVGIGYRVSEDTAYCGCPSINTISCARCPLRPRRERWFQPVRRINAVAHHAARGDEKSRHLFGQHGQERRLHALFNHGTPPPIRSAKGDAHPTRCVYRSRRPPRSHGLYLAGVRVSRSRSRAIPAWAAKTANTIKEQRSFFHLYLSVCCLQNSGLPGNGSCPMALFPFHSRILQR